MRLFLLWFFLIYASVHVYAFLKARAALRFGTASGALLALFMLIMVLAPAIVRVSEGWGLESSARVLSRVGYGWLGVLFLFFCASLALDLYRVILHIGGVLSGAGLQGLMPSARAAFLLPLAVSFAGNIYGYFEAWDIRVERLSIRSPKITEPLKMVQISDVHLGLIVREARLKRILDRVRDEAPDVLVSTGDLVDGQINDLAGLALLFRQINPRLGKFAITGNHEYYAGIAQALEFTRDSGFRLLVGEGVALPGSINIAGVDDPTGRFFGAGAGPGEADLIGGLPRENFTIFLKHRPLVDEGSRGLFDLQLSGHTHRGQIFPFRLVTRIAYHFVSGLYRLDGGGALYVSRGTGTWGPPVRVLSPPEVTVIELMPESTPRLNP